MWNRRSTRLPAVALDLLQEAFGVDLEGAQVTQDVWVQPIGLLCRPYGLLELEGTVHYEYKGRLAARKGGGGRRVLRLGSIRIGFLSPRGEVAIVAFELSRHGSRPPDAKGAGDD